MRHIMPPRPAAVRAPVLMVGHCRHMPLQETLKQSPAGLLQFLVVATVPFPGSWGEQDFFCALQASRVGGMAVVWGFILNVVALLLLSCCGFLFAFGCGVSFTGGFQHSPVHGCSATSCKFGVFTREDECMSFLGLQNHSRWWLQPSN